MYCYYSNSQYYCNHSKINIFSIIKQMNRNILLVNQFDKKILQWYSSKTSPQRVVLITCLSINCTSKKLLFFHVSCTIVMILNFCLVILWSIPCKMDLVLFHSCIYDFLPDMWVFHYNTLYFVVISVLIKCDCTNTKISNLMLQY